MELETFGECPRAGDGVEKVAYMAIVLLEAELVKRVCWGFGWESW